MSCLYSIIIVDWLGIYSIASTNDKLSNILMSLSVCGKLGLTIKKYVLIQSNAHCSSSICKIQNFEIWILI